MDLNQLTICQAHEGLKKKEFSSFELTKACLAQIKKKDKKINAFINVFEEDALIWAKQADKKGTGTFRDSPLAGIPLAIKDNILVKDKPCTAGSKILADYKATYDGTVIKKLRQAGAIFLGKTNLDEFAMGASTETSYFGATRNPHDKTRVPGGSSGGSAAAVCACMCPGALGSDTGGSIRQPASFCGLVGLKPTYGRVSRSGLIAMASSLDQISPIARTVDDAAVLLSAIEGKDPLDSTSQDLMFTTGLPQEADPKKFTLGIPKEYFVKGLDPEIKKAIEKVIKNLEKAGARICEVSLPHTRYGLAAYYIIMPAEVSANLARYDGIKYGFSSQEIASLARNDKRGRHCEEAVRPTKQSLLDIYLQTRTQGFGDEARRRIMLGTYTLSAGYYEAYYLKAQKVRTLIKKDFTKVFKKVDALITPTSPSPAFKIGEKIEDPLAMYLSDVYTVNVNLAGLPAISLPVGKVGRLPIGLQLIGNYFEENKLLEIAKIIEHITHNT